MTERHFTRLSTCVLVVLGLALALAAGAPGYSLAFPTAEGFGRNATGGRGGRVIHVTNLYPAGPGSFRAAVEASGPRIIVFDVAGTIYSDPGIYIENPDCTIAGQTAPAPGVTLATVFGVNANNVIVRHLRIAVGDPVTQHPSMSDNWNGIAGIQVWSGANPVMIDHCSVRWVADDSTCAGPNTTVTYQHCLIAEGLETGLDSPAGALHSKGFFAAVYNSESTVHATFHHNVIAKMSCRNPCYRGGDLDFVNNLIYAWGSPSLVMPNTAVQHGNFVGNYYKPGPWSSSAKPVALLAGEKWGQYAAQSLTYLDGNIDPVHRTDDSQPETKFVDLSEGHQLSPTRLDFGYPQVFTHPNAIAARDYLLNTTGPQGVGATVPQRDAYDTRYLQEIISGTGGHPACVADTPEKGYPRQPNPAIIRDASYPDYDRDQDGMPDAWETAHGLDPGDASDGSRYHANGYTNVENFLNELAGDKVSGTSTGGGKGGGK